MSDKYTIKDNVKAYFITITTVGWIDIFTRPNHKFLVVNSLKYCKENKGLIIYAYCLMHSHLHMICQAKEGCNLSDILRDFKSFTSRKLIEQIIEYPESRREWMLKYFSIACSHLKRKQNYKIWQDGYHAKEINSNAFLFEKLEYIHNNPVNDLVVEKPEEYLFSSARNYAELDSYLDVEVLGHKPLISNWK